MLSKAAILIILSIMILVSVSGCTMPGPSAGGGAGVVITDFAPEFPEYYVNEPVNFRVRIKNTGSVDAKSVLVEIFNLEGWEAVGSNECMFEKLIAPNPDMGTSGESKTCTFKFRAPEELPQGISFTYHPAIRLSYTYESATVKSVTMASQSELRNIQNTGKALPADTISSTQGPVAISIETAGPIRFWEDTGSVLFPIEIKVTNTGTGTAHDVGAGLVYGGEIGYEDVRNKFEIETFLPQGMVMEENSCGNSEIELWQGRTYESVCKVRASSLSLSAPVQEIITVKAYYDYIIDQQSSVTVKWRETAS